MMRVEAEARALAAESRVSALQDAAAQARVNLDVADETIVSLREDLTAAEGRIKALEKRADHYGVALMMIRAGCSDPARFAGNILDDKQPIDIDIEDELP